MEEKYSVKLSELTQESEKDIKIDFLKLQDELVHNQNLIGKWMTHQQIFEIKYQFLELEHKKLLASKTKYYTGKMSEDEIISKGIGKSKKKAEQDSAKNGLIHFNVLT